MVLPGTAELPQLWASARARVLFADVGKVQIEPLALPVPTLKHHTLLSSPSGCHPHQPSSPAGQVVQGTMVHPSQARPKPQTCASREAGTTPSLISTPGALDQAKLWTALLLRCKKLLQVSKKTKQTAKSWVILSSRPLSQWKYKEGRKP